MLEYPGKCRCALPEETCRVRRSFPDNVRREERLDMKSIKSKIQISMLSVVLIGSVLIGVITALLNASGIDDVMTKTLGPATQMAADAVEWRMGNYWTALQEAAASDIFRDSGPTAPELVPVRDSIAQRMIQGETGFGSYNFYGDNKLVGYAPIGGSQNWSIAIEASQREFKSTLDRSIMLTLLVVALVVLASFPIAVLVGRSISSPIQSCVSRLEKLADGDLQTPTPTVASRDETAKLTRALDTTILRLNGVVQNVAQNLGRMAGGDFRDGDDRTYVGDFEAIDQSIRSIRSSLRDILYQISRSAGTVAGGANDVSDSAMSLSQGAAEQASAVCELSATAGSIAETARQTAAAAEEAGRFVDQAGAQLGISVEYVKELNGAMEKISGSASEIGKIIDTIENIAFQTNILALNAAVEAARAGSAGKGFAVVADEVRNLASKSDEAAKATKELIEDSIASVREGGQVVRRVTESLDKTSAIAGNVTIKVNSVVESVEGQTAAISQVTEGINQISSVVQITSGATEQSAATAQELSDQSRLMNELVRRFCLE